MAATAPNVDEATTAGSRTSSPRLEWIVSREETDPRATLARPDALRFIGIIAQLAAIAAAFFVFRLEDPTFMMLWGIVVVGFAVHYWLPFQYKESFLVILSMGSAFFLLQPLVAALVLGIGLGFYGILCWNAHYWARVGVIAAIAVAIMVLRALEGGSFGIPSAFWPILGSIFMFRMIIYLYDLKHAKSVPNIREYLAYFFMLPNYYFLLFPVVDFRTMRKSYYQAEIHKVAQKGIEWIIRGLIQLIIYRLVYQYQQTWSPETITNLPALIREMVLIYLLYLRVSGTFHIIVGVMHLFGYNLPETHRSYLLSNSLTDFWRRINIYWKDFMVKFVYFPVYFRFRKRGDVTAQVIATVLVFIVTWFLHSYQFFWFSGKWLLTGPDIAFWSILGGLVVVNMLVERKLGKRKVSAWQGKVLNAMQVAAMLSFIVVLWSLWNTPSIAEWIDIVTYWQVNPMRG